MQRSLRISRPAVFIALVVSVAAVGLVTTFLAVEGCGDMQGPHHDSIESAPGLTPALTDLLDDMPAAVPSTVDEATPGDPTDPAGDAPPESADGDIGLVWTFEPPMLQVYRSTAIHFRLDHAPDEHGTASCSWNFGDGSPVESGCTVSHTFHGGQADQMVTLTLSDGDWSWESTRTVPLERLEVIEGLLDDAAGEAPALAGLPARPEASDTSFRFAVIADTAADGGIHDGVTAAMGALRGGVQPDLVVHAGGLVTTTGDEEAWDSARNSFGALTAGDIPLAYALSPTDRARGGKVGRAAVQMVDDRFFPERYTFTHRGAFFLVFSSTQAAGVDEETIQWMRDELAKARVYDARYVVTYLPLHKFGNEHLGTLDKRFRLYELFLRARVTTLFSAGYRVYFKGRYGALPVVSVGALAGTGSKLAGSDFAQPTSLVVVDQIKGVPERVFAVEGPTFDRLLDEASLPETVEVYTR